MLGGTPRSTANQKVQELSTMDMPRSIQSSLLQQRPPTEQVKQRLQDIVGNPSKTAICLPSKAELRRTNWAAFGFAAAWWFTCFYTNSVVQHITKSRNAGHSSASARDNTLYDLAFEYLPRVNDVVADVWVWVFVAITFVRFWMTQQRFVIMKRYVLILGLTFLIRSFTIVATLLPQPQKSCVATAVGNPFLDGLLIMLLQKKTCTDMFYSGHTVNLSMAAMLWTMFSHSRPIVPLTAVDRTIFCGKPVMDRFGRLLRPTITKIVAWICVFVGCFFISATRLHYLIDVCMGMFVSVTLFLLYHNALDRALTGSSPFSRFLRWFESDSSELELQRYQLGLFKEQAGLEQIVVDEEDKAAGKADEEDRSGELGPDESNSGDPHKDQ